MKKRFIKYALFVVLTFIADQVAGTLIAHFAGKQVRDNRVGLLLNDQIHSDIIILGSSRALNNYIPAVITAITGKSCYNLGVSGSNILFHETLLDLILSRANKPKMIVYNIDDYGTLFSMEGIVFRKDVLYPYVDNGIVHASVCRELHKNEIASMLMKTYRHNVNFINATKYLVYGREAIDYKTTNFDSSGANILVQRPEDPVPVFGKAVTFDIPGSPDPELAGAFKRIQQKCIDNNIQLLLTLPPLFIKDTPGFKQMIASHMLPGIKMLDLAGQLQEPKYFYNKDHMNSEGAAAFSKMVGAELNKSGL